METMTKEPSESTKDFFDLPFWHARTKTYHLRQEQALTGIGFDVEGAKTLLVHIDSVMEKLASEVEPLLPERTLNQGELKNYQLPAKPYKKDGTLSATMEKWLEKHGASTSWDGMIRVVKFSGRTYPIEGGAPTVTTGPMRLANQEDIKDWLLEIGWKPTLWNFKKDPRTGKPIRENGEYVKTSPKMQENGKLCTNLEHLSGDLVKKVVKWLSYRNRKSVIEGWLENPRLAVDGRLSTASSGLTNTHRSRHAVVCNIPKAEDSVTLGKEVRALFRTPRPGYVFVGYDATALEARVEAHYCLAYPGGKEHAETLLDGDVHAHNTMLFYGDQLAKVGVTHVFDGFKDDPRCKSFRSKSKNGKYASLYGASPKKLASTLGLSEERGQELYDKYWEGNPALKMLRERLTLYWEKNGKKKIKGIDGCWLYSRSKHSLVNLLFQSTGAQAMDYSGMFMDKWLGGLTLDKDGNMCYNIDSCEVYRNLDYHDEFLWEVPEHLADKIGKMGVRSIEQAGKYLKMRVPLTGEYKIGPSWASVH